MEPISRRAALLGLTAVAVAGCSATSQNPGPSGLSPTWTPTPTPSLDPNSAWALTGVPLTDPGAAAHVAVGVKVPDNKREHPQLGIDKADIVFVELDGYRGSSGYSGTRLLPVYHSQLPDSVGPVRSIRPVDIAVLAPMRAIVANTGGADYVVNLANASADYIDSSLTYMNTYRSGTYSIDNSRVYTLGGQKYYDMAVMAHPNVLVQQSTRLTAGPDAMYFPFAATGEQLEQTMASGAPANAIQVPWQGADYIMSYAYDAASNTYVRSMPWGPHVMADGAQIAPTNVLIILATQTYEHDEPIHGIVDASGRFYYATGGKFVQGTWSKGAVHEHFNFALDDGTEFRMAAGQTFVELADVSAPVSIS